jgi:hypothetical protein
MGYSQLIYEEREKMNIDKELERSKRYIWIILVVALGSYFLWFVILSGSSFSNDPAAWGQFGDFIGGVLNPSISFVAFFWIARSVKVQNEELNETRKTLKETSEMQQSLLISSKNREKISAMTSLLLAATSKTEAMRLQVEHYRKQKTSDHPSKYLSYNGKFIQYLEFERQLEDAIRNLENAVRYETEISANLNELM